MLSINFVGGFERIKFLPTETKTRMKVEELAFGLIIL